MKALLDTHVFLWWITADDRLSPRSRELLKDAHNRIFVSAASGWEIAIKMRLGKLELKAPSLSYFLLDELARNDFEVLPVSMDHAVQTYRLPLHHRDPFDRMLVAQAQLEELPLVTSDRFLGRYDVEILW